mmetsp:Transcript_83583/g.235812  ORF Transcript_83583/g.235812 Transcript_83583/m.235812 type:complete len:134 (+) Transcript_83583:305-706(+)
MDPTELESGGESVVKQPAGDDRAAAEEDTEFERGGEESEGDAFDDLFERDLRQMGEQVGNTVGAVVNGLRGTWTEHKVGERAKSAGLGAIRCIRRKPGQFIDGAAAGLNLITDAADFWVRDMCENQVESRPRQ